MVRKVRTYLYFLSKLSLSNRRHLLFLHVRKCYLIMENEENRKPLNVVRGTFGGELSLGSVRGYNVNPLHWAAAH